MLGNYNFNNDLPIDCQAEEEAVRVLKTYFPCMTDVKFYKIKEKDSTADIGGRRFA